ncbi:MAG TPA: HAMP domain-containing sensor histidine kinase [Streptosporangiaceae bacterium]|nr:HAMP domain-containing sensor histidine kinase [Streptosporangiaceae bacterium]
MAGLVARLGLRGWLRALRPTARLRLTMLYSALFLTSGAVLLTATNLLVDKATDTLPLGVFRSFIGDNPATCDPIKGACQAARLLAREVQDAQLRAFELHELRVWSAVALGLVAVLSVALGWLVAGRVLRPVRKISATARQIGASNLNQRLRLDGPGDEFGELAATLNGLLARLQASFDSQRRFVASASHELRTPLTLDRALLERALRHPEPTQALWRTTCERLLVSSQQQDRLIQALLTLARSEAGVARNESFELAAAIDTVLLSPELHAASQELQIRTAIGPAQISGDPRLAERLVRNLVDNAIRYNQPHGRVGITAGTRNGRAVLAVTNTGPPIPPADIDRLFQPFQRLTPNRGSHADGTGLGLSIVKAIADAHQATITAHPQPHGGLRIEVSFPPAGPDHDPGIANGHARQSIAQTAAPRGSARPLTPAAEAGRAAAELPGGG